MLYTVAEEQGSPGLDAVAQMLATHVQEAGPGEESADTDDEDDWINGNDMAMITAFLNAAPKKMVTVEQAKQAFKYVKRTPVYQMSSTQQEYLKQVQANGGDLSRGAMGLARAERNVMNRLTFEQRQRVLATTTLKEYVDFLKSFEDQAAVKTASGVFTDVTDVKKKRNNRNKNKNRKLKQKAVKASGAAEEDDSDADDRGDSFAVSASKAITYVVAPVFGGRNGNPSHVGAQEQTLTWQSGSGTLPDMDAYMEARRKGKMIIDGVEYARC